MAFGLDRLKAARAVLIAGPTASGKSALAMRIAADMERAGRTPLIANADSMQVYRELRVLTARPSEADEARFAHRLFGTVPACERYSLGRWLEDAAAVLSEAEAKQALPVFVGGTGLYFRALTEGIAPVPAIGADIRGHWAGELGRLGPEALHAILRGRDPGSADRVRPSDPQRILRALEVLDATGRPLRDWQRDRPAPLVAPEESVRIVLDPDRTWLQQRINRRLDVMLDSGALEEVSALSALGLPPSLPACKAIGVRELGSYLRGEIGLAEASERAKAESRRYAKRQRTWFRHQMPDWERMAPEDGGQSL